MKKELKILIEKLGYKTDSAFADAIGVKKSRLSAFLSGQTKYPTLDVLISIKIKFPQVNLNALIGFEGPLILTPEELAEQEKLTASDTPPTWQLYIDQLKKENDNLNLQNEHLRKQNEQFMQLLQEQKSKS